MPARKHHEGVDNLLFAIKVNQPALHVPVNNNRLPHQVVSKADFFLSFRFDIPDSGAPQTADCSHLYRAARKQTLFYIYII